jgi:hypothetical protein
MEGTAKETCVTIQHFHDHWSDASKA